jgi:hypothetical protein
MKHINTFFLFIILAIFSIAYAQEESGTPVIAFNWLNFTSETAQCLVQAEAAMAASEFSGLTRTTKAFVVGAHNKGYKGMILCIPSRGLVFFTVSGDNFPQASQLTQQLKNNFNAELDATTPTTYRIGNAPEAPYMAYNWQHILPNCVTRAAEAMTDLGFSVNKKKSLVIGNHDSRYKGVVICLANNNLAYFSVSGANFSDAQKLTTGIKARFNGEKIEEEEVGNMLTISSSRANKDNADNADDEDEETDDDADVETEKKSAPSISYHWQETGANTTQCLKEAESTMTENGFAAETKRSLVVGANQEGYKGVVVCIPAKKMAVFIVGGDQFSTAAKLSNKLKADF